MTAAMFDTRKVIDVYLKPFNLCLSDFVVKKGEVIQEVLHIVKRIISNKCSTRLTEKSVEFGIRLREFFNRSVLVTNFIRKILSTCTQTINNRCQIDRNSICRRHRKKMRKQGRHYIQPANLNHVHLYEQ